MKCCLCEKEIIPDANGWAGGHNAAPVSSGRCCNDCNYSKVLPSRLARFGFTHEAAVKISTDIKNELDRL